jgi:hypothetical protein
VAATSRPLLALFCAFRWRRIVARNALELDSHWRVIDIFRQQFFDLTPLVVSNALL